MTENDWLRVNGSPKRCQITEWKIPIRKRKEFFPRKIPRKKKNSLFNKKIRSHILFLCFHVLFCCFYFILPHVNIYTGHAHFFSRLLPLYRLSPVHFTNPRRVKWLFFTVKFIPRMRAAKDRKIIFYLFFITFFFHQSFPLVVILFGLSLSLSPRILRLWFPQCLSSALLAFREVFIP